MLTRYQIESELSLAYLHALSAKVAYAVDVPHIDSDSVDAIISAKGKVDISSIKHAPRIEVQLKATINSEQNNVQKIPLSISIKNYNELRADTVLPRLLIVLALPKNESQWIVHQNDKLILQKCAYYLNLKGLPESTNQERQTVYIPSQNILTPVILQNLMIKASKLENL